MSSISAPIALRPLRLRSLPTPTWTMAALNAASAFALGMMVLSPLTTHAPVRVEGTCAVLLGLVALVTLRCSDRVTEPVLLLEAFGRVLVAATLACFAKNAGGTLVAGAGFIWVSIWVSAFFARDILILALALELGGAVLATAINPDHLRTATDMGAMFFTSVMVASIVWGVVESLRGQARHDQLTGLLNRYGVDQALHELDWRPGHERSTSLVAFDLDGLKAVNDVSGHLAGDRTLIAFANELAAATRAGALSARVGGDEFIAILPGYTAADAANWASEMRGRTAVSWSFGVSERRDEEPLEVWLSRADKLMYAAKAAGRRQRRDHLVAALN